MKILPDHSLDAAKKVQITPGSFSSGGRPMNDRVFAVVHYTEGMTGLSSIDWWRNKVCLKDDIGAHFVIDRDGEIFQVRACNRTISHAGRSKWKSELRKKSFVPNLYSIGIELANAGSNSGIKGEEKIKGYAGESLLRHRNQTKLKTWENYSEEQINSLIELLKALKERYKIEDVTGHDCIAPDRKEDPGPAFPMERVRTALGFKGLPTVFW